MPRRSRISFTDNQPGLFDHLDNLPVHPAIDEAARRMVLGKIEEERSRMRPLEPLMFMSFGSGSSGNCAYLGDRDGGFLIDAGVDAETVVKNLRRHGIEMSHVRGIILTHDHSDHVRYAYAFLRHNSHMALYCTPKALNGMLRRHNISRRIKDYHRPIYKEFEFALGNFKITPFEVSHDGTDNAGFFISHSDGRHTFAVATDLGCITPRVDHYMRLASHIMLEANYDLHTLLTGRYPEHLKQRIQTDAGHLDNAVTASFLRSILSPRLRSIFLCHLSLDNNTPEKALSTVSTALLAPGGVASINDETSTGAPIRLVALPRFDASPMFMLTPED